MTKAKTTNGSDLLPSLTAASHGFALATVPIITAPALTRDEKYILAQGEKQKLKIQMTAAKTAYAITKAGELQTCAGHVFASTCGKIDGIEESAATTNSALYVKRFAAFQRDQLADQVTTLYAKGMGVIQGELQKLLPDEAPAPKGLLDRLRRG